MLVLYFAPHMCKLKSENVHSEQHKINVIFSNNLYHMNLNEKVTYKFILVVIQEITFVYDCKIKLKKHIFIALFVKNESITNKIIYSSKNLLVIIESIIF